MKIIYKYLPAAVVLVALLASNVCFAVAAVPERSAVALKDQWQLQDIYADEALWQQDFAKIAKLTDKVVSYQGKLQNPSALLQCLQASDELQKVSEKLYMYAKMHGDEDMRLAKYQSMTGDVEYLLTQAGAALAFIEPEILAMPAGTIEHLLSEEPALADYKFSLENLLRQKQHVLSAPEESLLSKSGILLATPTNVYGLLSNADMKFAPVKTAAGDEVQLTEETYTTLIKSPDRKIRQQAFTNLYSAYQGLANTYAAILNGSMKGDAFIAAARNYPSSLAAGLADDNVAPAVYTNLIATVQQNLTPLHRYIALKKQILAVPQLHVYDLYVPLTKGPIETFSYESGLHLLGLGLQPLGNEYVDNLLNGAENGWVDRYANQGKRSGAYHWGPYGTHPFVLINYDNTYNAVSTLAHEMGHAMHSYYSDNKQPYVTADYPIFCAEVASTTNQVLLLNYMLNQDITKEQRIYLLSEYLEQVRATVYRQTLFAEFELIMHEKVDRGETLTAEQLGATWRELNVKYYGDALVVDPEITVEWARIPHFYTSFYVYKYVTGYAAATFLADKLLQDAPNARQQYLDFLSSGGSDYPIELLKQAGVDMSSAEPIEITLKKFNAALGELEILLKN